MGVMVKKLGSLKCEVRIVEARNVEIKPQASTLFVRFYLSAGHNRKIEVNTREICSKSDNHFIWDQSFGLECQGNGAAVEELKRQRVVFELRRRKTSSFLKKSSRSEVVGSGEVSWESVFESPGMEIERFVVMSSEKKKQILEDDQKPVLLKIALKVQALETEKMSSINKKEKRLEKLCVSCSSRDCKSCNCLDYEAFALACALDCM